MRHELQHWDQIRAQLSVVLAGVGQTGLAPLAAIQRRGDGLWLQADGTWGGFAAHVMPEVDAVRLPGLYEYPAPVSALTYPAGRPGYRAVVYEATYGILQYVAIDLALLQVALADTTVADDGGELMTGTASWPTDAPVYVYFVDADGERVPCYSGVAGQENACWSTDGLTLQWVSPPMPLGTYTLEFEAPSFAAYHTEPGVTVVKRSFSTRLYGLRASTPPPRQVGPRSIADEEV